MRPHKSPEVALSVALLGWVFFSLLVSLRLSLFSVALSSDGRDRVAAVQSEMGSTDGNQHLNLLFDAISILPENPPDLLENPQNPT